MFYGRFGYANPEPRQSQPFLILPSKTCDRPISSRPHIARSTSETLQVQRQIVPQKRPSEDGAFQTQGNRRRVEGGPILRSSTCPVRHKNELLTASPNLLPRPSRHHGLSVEMERHDSSESFDFGESSPYDNTLTDTEAWELMRRNFLRRRRNKLPERLLLQVLNARVKLDDDALDMMAGSADRAFFHGKLKGRMTWKWSLPGETRFENEVVGTTDFRRAQDGGFETRITLSEPLLMNENYDKRLLLSTFLHELIHCYLFICCGFQAKNCGGHTEGFRMIAKVIDKWASEEGGLVLGLCDMDANLNDFRILSVPIYVGPPRRNAVCCGDSFHIIREAIIVEDDEDRKAWYIPPSGGF